MIFSGEQKLAMASVVLAINDVAAFAINPLSATKGRNFQTCWGWVNSERGPGDYPFDRVCEVIGLDADDIRARLFQVLDHPNLAETLLNDLAHVRKQVVTENNIQINQRAGVIECLNT